MKNFFIEQDFYNSSSAFACARAANEKLQRCIDLLPKLYGTPKRGYTTWPADNDTHTAVLFDLKEIPPKPCDHDPDANVYLYENSPVTTHTTKCRKCNVTLYSNWKPK